MIDIPIRSSTTPWQTGTGTRVVIAAGGPTVHRLWRNLLYMASANRACTASRPRHSHPLGLLRVRAVSIPPPRCLPVDASTPPHATSPVRPVQMPTTRAGARQRHASGATPGRHCLVRAGVLRVLPSAPVASRISLPTINTTRPHHAGMPHHIRAALPARRSAGYSPRPPGLAAPTKDQRTRRTST